MPGPETANSNILCVSLGNPQCGGEMATQTDTKQWVKGNCRSLYRVLEVPRRGAANLGDREGGVWSNEEMFLGEGTSSLKEWLGDLKFTQNHQLSCSAIKTQAHWQKWLHIQICISRFTLWTVIGSMEERSHISIPGKEAEGEETPKEKIRTPNCRLGCLLGFAHACWAAPFWVGCV